MKSLAGSAFNKRSSLRAWLTNPSIRAAFWMRISSRGGILGVVGRSRLLSGYSCDVSAGAALKDALFLPHPIGIVIGKGVQMLGPVTIYQGVTFGANKSGEYPTLMGENKIFPNSVIVGGIELRQRSTIGAGAFVDHDVVAGQVIRGRHRS